MAKRRPLDDYAKKRDFARTSEPPPDVPPARPQGPVFVVHRHEARNLHYDLRLERDGVLVSFAVPKGFSYASDEKHLAVRTEDHPLAYEDFHGVIPKGEYGAGTMTIWDKGRYELKPLKGGAEPFQAGELKLVLFGRRLRGEWHLVKTKGGPNHWLIFKSKDRYAGVRRDTALGIDLARAPEAALPDELAFQEPGAARAPFSDAAWLFEARFEGLRVLAQKKGDGVRWLGARAGLALPMVEADLAKIRAVDALLDGILVRLDEHERPSRAGLDAALAAKTDEGVVFYASDLLHWEDYDLRELPLLERKQALRAILPALPRVLLMEHVAGEGEGLARAVAAAGLPGVVAKRADAPWRPGPSEAWCRIDVQGDERPSDAAPAGPVTELLDARRGKAAVERRAKYTNLDKVYFPADGITKGELVAYYEAVADVLVPYLRGRPVHLNRFPDGIEGKSFYQKEAKEKTPDWIRTVVLASKSREEGVLRYMVCDDRATLMHLVNLGSIDLHPWMSRVETPDSPDYAVLDLDPKEAPFAHVVRIARELGRILRGIGLRPLLKTSGKTGLHVMIPLTPGHTYEHSALFCEGIARLVVRELPAIATVERAIQSRDGKVYVDFGQNRKGQTVVPPYVVRPVRGATVSTPLVWDELESELSPALFTVHNVPERLARLGDLFQPLLTDLQEIAPAIGRLEAYLAVRK